MRLHKLGVTSEELLCMLFKTARIPCVNLAAIGLLLSLVSTAASIFSSPSLWVGDLARGLYLTTYFVTIAFLSVFHLRFFLH